MNQVIPQSRVHQYASKVTALLRQHPLTEKQTCSQEGLFIPCMAKFREGLASMFPDDFVPKKLIFGLSLYVGYTFKSLSIALFRIICMTADS